MILRISAAALGLLALGSSISAVNAADAAPVPAVATPADAADLPRFEAAFDDMGDPAAIAVPESAVDIAAIEPALEPAVAEDIPDGVASWYGAELAGRKTANGERFDPDELTAAHRTLPMGSKVRVTYSGRSVVVRINDRGPFHGNRVIDLSRAAADQIGLRQRGSGHVELALLAS